MKVDKLVKNVYETIMASGMICQGDSVVVGVSGGADSVCLLSVLKNLQMSMALQLTAVHIHHGLRGEAADRDRDFVTALCEDMRIPCVCFQADIRAMAREQHYRRKRPEENFAMTVLKKSDRKGRHLKSQWLITGMIWQRQCC